MQVLLFSQSECTPCNQLSRWLIMNSIPFTRFDVFVDIAEFRKYGVMSTPTVVLLDSMGVESHRAVGLIPSVSLIRTMQSEITH